YCRKSLCEVAAVQDLDHHFRTEGSTRTEIRKLVADCPRSRARIENFDWAMNSLRQLPMNKLREDIALVYARRSVRDRITKKHQAKRARCRRRRHIIGPHAPLICPNVCEEAVDILVGLQNISASCVGRDENRSPEPECEPQNRLEDQQGSNTA